MPDQIITLNDGRAMPRLGLGTWQVAEEEAAEVVRTALAAGYRHIDTAMFYQNEHGVGAGIAASPLPRGDLFVTTKLWNDAHEPHAARQAFAASLQRLGVDSIDLYLIHWPVPSRGLYVETWRTLIGLREEGRVRSIGVSNFTADHLRRIIDETGVTPAANQVELHPRFQQRALRRTHEELGIATICWSPLGQGGVLKDPVIRRIADKHGRTPAQVVLRWELQSNLLTVPKSTNPKRMAENFDVFDFALEEGDMHEMAALDSPTGRIGPDPDDFGP